jgi:hypothetical protein
MARCAPNFFHGSTNVSTDQPDATLKGVLGTWPTKLFSRVAKCENQYAKREFQQILMHAACRIFHGSTNVRTTFSTILASILAQWPSGPNAGTCLLSLDSRPVTTAPKPKVIASV